ncbi:MAG: 2,3-bisphosphoglycerate-independent phosphoglycerate mutase [Clostridiales bacterium]|nr:2,3-bisphosphoglycerate-independent phosphoglycerate mutase [Clostridiales bacterium]
MKNPLTLIIMDGYGLTEKKEFSAIDAVDTPNLDRLFSTCPVTKLSCSGNDVGLPEGQMGNSEVGHTNIGAGRVVYQELTRITKAIQDGTFFENDTLLKAIENCKNNNTALHLMGLLSDGGVHSHNSHLYALLRLAKQNGLDKVFIHCFLDGRDVPPESGKQFVAECIQKTKEIGVGQVATLMGRYYAMDRDNRFERVKRAYDAIVLGEGKKNSNPVDAVFESYNSSVTDEFVEPVVCLESGKIQENDSVIFFNFRPDRARELTRALVDSKFDGFEHKYFPVFFVCFTQYDASMPNVEIAFKPQALKNTFGEYISNLGLTQLRIAETEKYAHVTFFFNGGVEQVYKGEDRILIPSPKVATYDLKPEMSAFEVTDAVCDCIESGKYDVIILNYANCDMVGHTGIFDAAKLAVETVDTCVGKTVDAVVKAGGMAIITADHGNAERMVEDDGVTPFTAHTRNPVPFAIVGANVKLKEGRLCDIAPTMLELMGLSKPIEMDGVSLIQD